MAALSTKLRSLAGGRVAFFCPGCNEAHQITVKDDPNRQGPIWGYNGDPDKPTFTPSVLVTGSQHLTDEQWEFIEGGGKIEPIRTVCHSFIIDGRIQFLGDCTHALAGQTVNLPDFPENER